jgi:hypothetical protein
MSPKRPSRVLEFITMALCARSAAHILLGRSVYRSIVRGFVRRLHLYIVYLSLCHLTSSPFRPGSQPRRHGRAAEKTLRPTASLTDRHRELLNHELRIPSIQSSRRSPKHKVDRSSAEFTLLFIDDHATPYGVRVYSVLASLSSPHAQRLPRPSIESMNKKACALSFRPPRS